MTSDPITRSRDYQAAIRRLILADWDPLGVAGIPEAEDLYDPYLPRLHQLLIAQRPEQEVRDYLWRAETTGLGQVGNRMATEKFARRLLRLPAELVAAGPPDNGAPRLRLEGIADPTGFPCEVTQDYYVPIAVRTYGQGDIDHSEIALGTHDGGFLEVVIDGASNAIRGLTLIGLAPVAARALDGPAECGAGLPVLRWPPGFEAPWKMSATRGVAIAFAMLIGDDFVEIQFEGFTSFDRCYRHGALHSLVAGDAVAGFRVDGLSPAGIALAAAPVAVRPRPPAPAAPPDAPAGPPPYRVYTAEFDRIVAARDLDGVLGALTSEQKAGLDAAAAAFEWGLVGWRTRTTIAALDAAGHIRAAVPAARRADTIVSLLIDHSGSMRGQNILMAMAVADIARDFLRGLGCRVEILGFTTQGWHGGAARKAWIAAGSPPAPGRLCALLHVIHHAADEAHARPLHAMLRPNLLRENVDGEAIEWAAGRLAARREARKILIVVSDGAPVDDATLAVNEPGILDRHLHSVVAQVQAAGAIDLAGIGIGHEVGRYYAAAVQVDLPDDLGSALLGLLLRLLLKDAAPA